MVLVVSGIALGGIAAFTLLFCFVFPRWWPTVVIRYSPSLRHVLIADSYRCDVTLGTGGRGYSSIPISDYRRFEELYGEHIFSEMAACDNGSNPAIRWVVLEYLGKNVHDPKARKVIWDFSDQGDDEARWLIRRHADSIPQGVNASQVLRTNAREKSSLSP
jgi:hypothetical protein